MLSITELLMWFWVTQIARTWEVHNYFSFKVLVIFITQNKNCVFRLNQRLNTGFFLNNYLLAPLNLFEGKINTAKLMNNEWEWRWQFTSSQNLFNKNLSSNCWTSWWNLFLRLTSPALHNRTRQIAVIDICSHPSRSRKKTGLDFIS